jgi:hypothetical protein
MGKIRDSYKILVGKPEGERSLGRACRRWEDNIRMNVRERGWEGVKWMQLDQDRDQWRGLVNTVMKFRVT